MQGWVGVGVQKTNCFYCFHGLTEALKRNLVVENLIGINNVVLFWRRLQLVIKQCFSPLAPMLKELIISPKAVMLQHPDIFPIGRNVKEISHCIIVIKLKRISHFTYSCNVKKQAVFVMPVMLKKQNFYNYYNVKGSSNFTSSRNVKWNGHFATRRIVKAQPFSISCNVKPTTVLPTTCINLIRIKSGHGYTPVCWCIHKHNPTQYKFDFKIRIRAFKHDGKITVKDNNRTILYYIGTRNTNEYISVHFEPDFKAWK